MTTTRQRQEQEREKGKIAFIEKRQNKSIQRKNDKKNIPPIIYIIGSI